MQALDIISAQIKRGEDGVPRVSSRDVAETFAKQHKNVLLGIEHWM